MTVHPLSSATWLDSNRSARQRPSLAHLLRWPRLITSPNPGAYRHTRSNTANAGLKLLAERLSHTAPSARERLCRIPGRLAPATAERGEFAYFSHCQTELREGGRLVPGPGLEPGCLSARDFKSLASTDSAIRAILWSNQSKLYRVRHHCACDLTPIISADSILPSRPLSAKRFYSPQHSVWANTRLTRLLGTTPHRCMLN